MRSVLYEYRGDFPCCQMFSQCFTPGAVASTVPDSIRKWPGWPADSRQMYNQHGQVVGKPAGFMDLSQDLEVTSDICEYLKISACIFRYPQASLNICRC